MKNVAVQLYTLKHITKAVNVSKLCDSLKDKLPENITQNELDCVQNCLMETGGKEKNNDLFMKRRNKKLSLNMQPNLELQQLGIRELTESTVRPWVKRYKDNLKEKTD